MPLPILRDELATHKARAEGPDAFVFATMTGTEQKGDEYRQAPCSGRRGREQRLTRVGDVPCQTG